MAENLKLETANIQTFSRELRDLPPVSNAMTKRRVVALLAGDIQRARDQGYTLKQIVEHLNRCGFDLCYDTLRHALPRQPRSRSGKNPPSGRASGGERAHGGGAPLRVVAPVQERVTGEGPPATSQEPPVTPRAPAGQAPLVFPPGASCVFTGDGQFVPAPDSDDL